MLGCNAPFASLAPSYPSTPIAAFSHSRGCHASRARQQVRAAASWHASSPEASENGAEFPNRGPQGRPSTSKPQLITQVAREPNISRRRGLMALGAAAMFGCACCADLVSPKPAEASSWQYGGDLPKSWPGVCSTGGMQSPINLKIQPKVESGKYPSTPLQFRYGKAEKVAVLNTGHGTMQVNFKLGNQVYVPPRTLPLPNEDDPDAEPCLCPTVPMNLELIQYHFHTPSEHWLDGRQTLMEAHLVHRDKDTGGLAVIAVLMEAGGSTPNPCLQLGLDFAPSRGGRIAPAKRTINPLLLLPPKSSRPYIHYQGSLTTPPCSESVEWFVMTTPVKVTDRQVLEFMQFAGGGFSFAQNSRPLQPVNNRPIEYYEYNI